MNSVRVTCVMMNMHDLKDFEMRVVDRKRATVALELQMRTEFTI